MVLPAATGLPLFQHDSLLVMNVVGGVAGGGGAGVVGQHEQEGANRVPGVVWHGVNSYIYRLSLTNLPGMVHRLHEPDLLRHLAQHQPRLPLQPPDHLRVLLVSLPLLGQSCEPTVHQ